MELYVIILNLSILLNLFSKIEHLKSCKLFTVEFALNPPPPWSRFWLLTRGGVFKAFLKNREIVNKIKNDIFKSAVNKGGGVFKRGGGI